MRDLRRSREEEEKRQPVLVLYCLVCVHRDSTVWWWVLLLSIYISRIAVFCQLGQYILVAGEEEEGEKESRKE